MTQSRRPAFRARPRARAPRRAVEWFDNEIDETITTSSQNVVVLSTDIADAQRKGMSIVRWIVDLTAIVVSASTGGIIHMGMYMASDEEIAAGAVADPGAVDDKPGWVFKMSRPVYASGFLDYSMGTPFQIDTKVRRRFLTEDYNPILVIDSGVLATSVNINGLIRLLAMKA